MKKLLMMIVLSFCFSGLAEAGNNFGFTIVGPGYAFSASRGPYFPYVHPYPYAQYYPMVPQPIITPMVPYVRQPVYAPVKVCQDTYTRDQYGFLFKNTTCWMEWLLL